MGEKEEYGEGKGLPSSEQLMVKTGGGRAAEHRLESCSHAVEVTSAGINRSCCRGYSRAFLYST